MSHRDDLLAAARTLLEDKGYAHITARDLVAASGTNLASIGYHFGSKAGLLNAAMGTVFEEWIDQLAEPAMADPTASLLERGDVTWTAWLAGLASKRKLLVSYLEALAQADRAPELRQELAGLYRTCRERVAGLVAESLGDGTSGDDPRCRAVAAFVVAVCDGLAVQWLVDPDGVPTPDELRAGLATLWSASFPPDGNNSPGRT